MDGSPPTQGTVNPTSQDAARRAAVLVLMGVSGCGKSTVGALLAERLEWPFKDGDALHPPHNLAKMARAVPLDDADRAPWLSAVAACIDAWRSSRTCGVITCSALKRRYRDIIIGGRDNVRLIYLHAEPALLQQRLAARSDHFMGASMLDSQLAALEAPTVDEHAIVLDVRASPSALVSELIDRLQT